MGREVSLVTLLSSIHVAAVEPAGKDDDETKRFLTMVLSRSRRSGDSQVGRRQAGTWIGRRTNKAAGRPSLQMTDSSSIHYMPGVPV